MKGTTFMNEETKGIIDDKHPDSNESGDKESPTESEQEKERKKKQSEIEENPDLEDPRLYSPLQEPDRPDPTERTHEEKDEPAEPCESSSHDEADNTTA